MGACSSISKSMECDIMAASAQSSLIESYIQPAYIDETQIYEELTKTLRLREKFHIQDQVISGSQLVQSKLWESGEGNLFLKEGAFQNFQDYEESLSLLQEILDPSEIIKLKDIKLLPISEPVGSGAQGNVSLRVLQANSNQLLSPKLIPIAEKYIPDHASFLRECSILLKIKGPETPKIIRFDTSKQTIYMEMCICSLQQLKPVLKSSYLYNDTFFTCLLLNLMNKQQELLMKGVFHGDMKPSNVALALRGGQAELVLIDFGASSWLLEDYGNYYSPPFFSSQISDILYSGAVLSLDQVRFAEFYSACRTVQYLMLDRQELNFLFQVSNTGAFAKKFQTNFPKVTKIITHFLSSQDPTISEAKYQQIMLELSFLHGHLLFDKEAVYSACSPLMSV